MEPVFMLTCPQLIVLCEHYLGYSIDRDKLRDGVYRDHILKLENRGYLEVIDQIFLDAKITERGKRRVQMAMAGTVTNVKQTKISKANYQHDN